MLCQCGAPISARNRSGRCRSCVLRSAKRKTTAISPGQKFARLTALRPNGKMPSGPILWLFVCECGRETSASCASVAAGKTKSCGCLSREVSAAMCRDKTTHGHAKKGQVSATYNTWISMVQRTTRSNHPSYPEYGGRGITLCERWLIFKNFLEDMGERPAGTTIDRIDNGKGYFLENCRWADARTQQSNTRKARIVIVDGEPVSFSEAARRLGMSRPSLEKYGHPRMSVPS